jgi:outer membrane protein assembly factor BamE (lipoprotein component of BamABCDE complex)
MRAIIILSILALVSGCMSVGRPIDQNAANQIKEGVTTKDEVAHLMGQPYQVARKSGGITEFTYIFVQASPKASSFIPFVGVFAGGANVSQQTLVVAFDDTNVVKSVTSTASAGDSGYGLTAQPGQEVPKQ